MTAALYTSDPTRVTSVRWSIASERVAAYDHMTDQYEDGPNDTARMRVALDRLAELVQATYPNCTDVYIVDGGFENQYASFGPACETDDDSMYEPFLDDMTAMEDEAIAAAWSAHEF